MGERDYFEDLSKCELCEHRCKVNRLAGETGVCRVTMPTVASATLHPAPPESYTVFMAGCNYKCLNCQNWTISQYPDNGFGQRGFEDPRELAKECVDHLTSLSAKLMGADGIFFSGGEPTIHLPYIEKVVEEARKIRPDTKVNFDTNGYMTEQSLETVPVSIHHYPYAFWPSGQTSPRKITPVRAEALWKGAWKWQRTQAWKMPTGRVVSAFPG
jgi:pyruvate formate lyase activating enzyme